MQDKLMPEKDSLKPEYCFDYKNAKSNRFVLLGKSTEGTKVENSNLNHCREQNKIAKNYPK